MADQSGPWSTGAGLSVDQWAQMMSTFLGAASGELFGVNGDPLSSDLKVFGDASGRQVKLPVGMAAVDGAWYYNDAQQVIVIGTNTSGLTRIDTVCLRRAIGSSNVTPVVVAGTPALSPVAPTLTNQDLRLADVTVANGFVTVAAGDVVDKRTHIPRGGIVCTHSTRPAVARVGQRIFESDTKQPYEWDGAVWQLVPTGDSGWTDLTGYASGWRDYATNNADSGSYHISGYRKIAGVVHVRGMIQRGSGGTGASANIVTFPTGFRPDSTVRFFSRTITGNVGVQVYIQVDGTVNIIVDSALALLDAFPICTSFVPA